MDGQNIDVLHIVIWYDRNKILLDSLICSEIATIRIRHRSLTGPFFLRSALKVVH